MGKAILLGILGAFVLLALTGNAMASNEHDSVPVSFTDERGIDIIQEKMFGGITVTKRNNGATNGAGDCTAPGNKTTGAITDQSVKVQIYDALRERGPEFAENVCSNDHFKNLVIFNLSVPTTTMTSIYAETAGDGSLQQFLWVMNGETVIGNATFNEISSGRYKLFLNGTVNGEFSQQVTSLRVVVNCHGGVCTSGTMTVRLLTLNAWNANNLTYPMHFAYAEYLAERAVNVANNAVSIQEESETVSFPAGKGYYYVAVQSDGTCAMGVSCHVFSEVNPNSSDLQVTFIGTSYLHSRPTSTIGAGNMYAIWQYNNTAGGNRVASIKIKTGDGDHTFPSYSTQFGTLFALNTTCSPASCAPGKGTTGTPFGARYCKQNLCNTGATSWLYSFGYRESDGPFLTYPFASAWGNPISTDNPSGFFDINDISTTAASWTNAADGLFYLDLTGAMRTRYVGNTIFLVAAKVGAADICAQTNSTISVNGVSVELAIKSNSFNTALADTVQYCGWILEDLTETLSLPLDSIGNNRYHQNGINGSRIYEIQFPANLIYNNWRVISTIEGQHSKLWNCVADSEAAGICFGNFDTKGFSVPGAIQNVLWRWIVQDAETGQPLNGTRIFEETSGTIGLTDVNGRLNITTTVPSVKWILTNGGYNPHYLNFSFLSVDAVNLTVNMSKATAKKFNDLDCGFVGQGNLTCTSNATSDVGQSCQEFYGTDGTCRKGAVFGTGLKVVQFGCPVDASGFAIKALANVTAYESQTANGFAIGSGTLGQNNNLNPMDCLTHETLAVQTDSQSWTFSKAGYRTIPFTADWLNRTVIKFVPIFKTGDGNANTISVGVTNGTINQSGLVKSATFITLTDTEPPAASVATTTGDAGLGFESSLIQMGDSLGFGSETGRIIWGFFLFVGILLFTIGGYGAVTKGKTPPPVILGVVGLVGFFVVAALGLWPMWLLIMVGLGFLTILAIIIKGAVGTAPSG